MRRGYWELKWSLEDGTRLQKKREGCDCRMKRASEGQMRRRRNKSEMDQEKVTEEQKDWEEGEENRIEGGFVNRSTVG